MLRLYFIVSELRLTHLTHVRPLLEYYCPVWRPQVQNTVYLKEEQEAAEKRVARIIMELNFQSYELSVTLIWVVHDTYMSVNECRE